MEPYKTAKEDQEVFENKRLFSLTDLFDSNGNSCWNLDKLYMSNQLKSGY